LEAGFGNSLVNGAVYDIAYDATDIAGNVGLTVPNTNVTYDTEAPVITLLGVPAMAAPFGSVYTDAGATAVDNVDGTITGSIVMTGAVDTSAAGVYTLNYDVTDAAGNAATTVHRFVTVSNGSGGGRGQQSQRRRRSVFDSSGCDLQRFG